MLTAGYKGLLKVVKNKVNVVVKKKNVTLKVALKKIPGRSTGKSSMRIQDMITKTNFFKC